MKQVNKTPQRKARLESTLSCRSSGARWFSADIEKLWRMNLTTGLGYTLWGQKWSADLGLAGGEVLFVVPDVFAHEWTEAEQKRWVKRMSLA